MSPPRCQTAPIRQTGAPRRAMSTDRSDDRPNSFCASGRNPGTSRLAPVARGGSGTLMPGIKTVEGLAITAPGSIPTASLRTQREIGLTALPLRTFGASCATTCIPNRAFPAVGSPSSGHRRVGLSSPVPSGLAGRSHLWFASHESLFARLGQVRSGNRSLFCQVAQATTPYRSSVCCAKATFTTCRS